MKIERERREWQRDGCRIYADCRHRPASDGSTDRRKKNSERERGVGLPGWAPPAAGNVDRGREKLRRREAYLWWASIVRRQCTAVGRCEREAGGGGGRRTERTCGGLITRSIGALSPSFSTPTCANSIGLGLFGFSIIRVIIDGVEEGLHRRNIILSSLHYGDVSISFWGPRNFAMLGRCLPVD